jgi:hypothetical protein
MEQSIQPVIILGSHLWERDSVPDVDLIITNLVPVMVLAVLVFRALRLIILWPHKIRNINLS